MDQQVTLLHVIKPRPRGHPKTWGDGSSQDDITHFPSFIEAPCASPHSLIKSLRRLPQDPAGIPPHFYQGITRETPKVVILEDLMTLVLRTKSISQWPFTLIDRTLVYL